MAVVVDSAGGALLDGRYRLDGLLGAGGMGHVYRALHVGINRPVAVKMLRGEHGVTAAAIMQFQREAIASGQLDHPNIVAVSDLGVLPDGNLFIVMELLEGESLGDRLAREGSLPWAESLELVRGVMAGLQHAHDHGVVHCDIKPDNLFLARKHGDTVVKILDFGIAQSAAGSASAPSAIVTGTPDYMAPEQATGAVATPAVDLYAASVVLYQMLCGHTPFAGADPHAKLLAHVHRDPPAFDPALAIPPRVEALVRAGLAKTPAGRPGSAADFQRQVEDLLRGAGLAPRPQRAASHPAITPELADDDGGTSYEILQSIGRGGMAEVFLARRRGPRGFEKLVVIKRLHAELERHPRFLEMFLDEARLAARINDPHVIQIHELGSRDGSYFIAMEYLDGETLDAIVERVAGGHPAPTPYVVARIAAEAAAGLQAAHELRDYTGRSLEVVHRDVSHSNIVVLYSGAVKVVDFGIAKARSQLGDGAGYGKPAYQSPEQIRGHAVDHRSDIFSLGVVLWETLTSRHLFASHDERATRQRILQGTAPPPSTFAPVPPELDRIVLRALEKDPADRYPTAEAMRSELEAFLLRSGQAGGAMEIAAYMRTTFPDRVEVRTRLLEAAQHDVGPTPPLPHIGRPYRPGQMTMLVMQPPRRVPRWALAAVAALAIGGVAIYAVSRAKPQPPTAAPIAVVAPAPAPVRGALPPPPSDPRIERVETAIAAGRLVDPPADNALELLAALERDHAGGVLVGRAYGAGDMVGVRRAGLLGFGTAIALSLLVCAGIGFGAHHVAAAYTHDAARRQRSRRRRCCCRACST